MRRKKIKTRDAAIRSERMDRRIVIQLITDGVHPVSGQPTKTPTTFATVWASVVPWQGREFTAAGQLSAEIDTRFHIRWISGLSATMRILYDGITFEIVRFEEVGRHDRLNIYAKGRQT